MPMTPIEETERYRDIPVGDLDLKALISEAQAYRDAVDALSKVTGGAPLSTTLGSLIESGWLVPDPAKQARDRGE